LQRRLERAIDMLQRSPASLEEIASACGFAGRDHFVRAFIAATGDSPEAWRRKSEAAPKPGRSFHRCHIGIGPG